MERPGQGRAGIPTTAMPQRGRAAWLPQPAPSLAATGCSKTPPSHAPPRPTHRHIEAELLGHAVVQGQAQQVQQATQVVGPAGHVGSEER